MCSRVSRYVSALALLLAATAVSVSVSAQTIVVTRDGERLEVLDYEVRGPVLVVTTLDGGLQSLALDQIDLEATEVANTGEVVALRFGWTAGMAAQVEVEASREQVERGEPRLSTSRMTHGLTVKDHPDGLLVELGDFDFELGLGLGADAQDDSMPRRVEALIAMTPSYVVSDAGEFVRIVGLDALIQAMEELLLPAREAAGEMGAESKALIDRLVSEDALTAMMAEQWNSMIGFWLDGELERHTRYELETEAPLPLIPGLTIPMRLEFAATDWVPCPEGVPETPCIELTLHSYPDAEQTKSLVASVVDRFGGGDDAPHFEELVVENRITLIADPDTLVPYVFETFRNVSVSGSAGGQDLAASRTDRRFTRFVWMR